MHTPPAPVSEPLCKCGHDNRLHRNDGRPNEWTPCVDRECDCTAFTPAPLSPSVRRTRDEGSEDEAECTCPPPWNNDHTPSPECPVHGIKLTKAELARLSQAVETDDGTGYIYAVAYAVESIIAARQEDA